MSDDITDSILVIADGASDDDSGETGQSIPTELPVLPVRDIVVFNYMILPLFVGREASVHAVDSALSGDRHILILTQRDESVDEPGPDDLYEVGTVGLIMRMLKMPDGRLKVLVQGLSRARVRRFSQDDPSYRAVVELMDEPPQEDLTSEQEAMVRAAKEQSEKIMSLKGISSPDYHERARLGQRARPPGRPHRLQPAHEGGRRPGHPGLRRAHGAPGPGQHPVVQGGRGGHHAGQDPVHGQGGHGQGPEGLLPQRADEGHPRRTGRGGEEDEEFEELRRALDKAKPPKDVRKEADKQLSRLTSMHPDSSEATVIRTYLDWIAELPWRKASRDRLDIKKAEAILNEDHYDLDKVKERILNTSRCASSTRA